MNVSNQKLFKLGMPQVIIEDTAELVGFGQTTEEMNKKIIDSMYKVQEAAYRLFSGCDIREVQANTINPAQQNLFIPLKQWIVNLGGCFAEISIHQRVLDGCYADFKVM